ncbi:MAG: hypothetical protein LBI84_08900, partial [Propionibacteriaceae bacterium]|nr:hypothetical protein [Propionibacteriaceae bacterium]
MAYFLVPLPDALGFPAGHQSRLWERVPEDLAMKYGPWLLGVSLCFHQVEGGQDLKVIHTLFDLAYKVFPGEGRRPPEHGAPGGPGGVSFPMTVVEMAIPLDVEDEMTEAESTLRTTEAFDKGMGFVRQAQQAYYAAARVPIRLVARESLPPIIPAAWRRLRDDEGLPLPFQAPVVTYLPNLNLPLQPSGWDDSLNERFETAMRHSVAGGFLFSYLDFLREANVALHRDGARRSAVIFVATACEILFDDTLAHLLWEEGMRPEDAAHKVYDRWDTVSKRVKSAFAPRLGGIWSLDLDGPVKRWFVNVSGLRNRVVHGGYEPTSAEASLALESASNLATHMSDLIADRVGKYGRTAMTLPGKAGLRARGKWNASLERLSADRSEVSWGETFPRWRAAMNRARKESPTRKMPSAADASVMVVIRRSGEERWVVHDTRAGMAAPVPSGKVMGVSADYVDACLERIRTE